MKKFLLSLAMVAMSVGTLLAQQTVSGQVTDAADGSALPGVNILEKGTTNGTVTDIDGNYTLSVSTSDAVLVFSFVGYQAQEVAIGGRTSINVGLAPDVTQLSEVVVVGYGTQEKKEITSAVASVGTEDFNNGNITDAAQLLQGRVAGLSITRPAGGDPNGGFNIRLRGLSTFGANSQPLIVIDGVIGASLDNLDPNDIESFDVLKDGSAAAIYGARGSSGVILVTTKSGAGGDVGTQVDFNGFVTIDNTANTVPILSANEFVERGGQDFGSETDWIDELTQTAVSYTANLSIGGSAGPNTNYRASVNYRNNEGVAINTGFERINTRLQINQQALDGKLRFAINASFNDRSQQSINNGAFRYAYIYNPTAPIFDQDAEQFDGYFQTNFFDFYNPVALANQQTFTGDNTNILLNGRVEYDILSNLTLAVNYGQDRRRGTNNAFWSKRDFQFGFGQEGVARKEDFNSINEILTGTITWNFEPIDDLDVTLTAGAETQVRRNDGFGVQVRRFLFDEQSYDQLAFGADPTDPTNSDYYSYRDKNTLNSGFARLNLNYDNTYFLSASVRSESYSGFGADEKTGIFPAVSGGVELSNLFDMGVVSSLKVRVGYGVTGNLPPSADLALPIYGPSDRIDFDENPLTRNDEYIAAQQRRDPNPTLKWEVKTEFDVGIDFGLFDDRLTGTIDYYRRNIDDLLYNVQLNRGATNPFDGFPVIAGNAWANIGELSQGGFEFSAAYNNIKLGPVSWTPSGNFTIYDKTTLENLGVGDLGISEIRLATPGSPGQNDNQIIRNIPGDVIGNMYGPEFLGIDEQGNYVLSSRNPDDWGVVGNGLPEGEWGLNNTFTYKNWDLNFFLRGVWGHDIYNSYRGFYEPNDNASKTWNSVNTDKADPRIVDTPTFSSLYVEDGTFVRLDNAQLGYNFNMGSSNVFTKLRVYAAGQNLFTITNYTGIDPEVKYTDTEDGNSFTSSLAPGIERRNQYFTVRSFTFGVIASLK